MAVNVDHLVAIGSGVIAIIAGISAFYSWLVARANKRVVTPALAANNEALARIEQQFKNNGGSSTKDALDRIEARQEAIERRWEDHLVLHIEEARHAS